LPPKKNSSSVFFLITLIILTGFFLILRIRTSGSGVLLPSKKPFSWKYKPINGEKAEIKGIFLPLIKSDTCSGKFKLSLLKEKGGKEILYASRGIKKYKEIINGGKPFLAPSKKYLLIEISEKKQLLIIWQENPEEDDLSFKAKLINLP